MADGAGRAGCACNGRGECGHGCLRFIVGVFGRGERGLAQPGAAERMTRWRCAPRVVARALPAVRRWRRIGRRRRMPA
ncbi:hypothetical protein C2U71_18465 [Burkholderia ubonensis]|nr:hypothetical protein C2U71_18465 [Burkholderia ubonensis]